MANINDYKLICKKSLRYFDLLNAELKIPNIKEEKKRERLWFYLFILEYITWIKDFDNLVKIITDTDFNKLVYGINVEDLWVDAVNIDEENNKIQLFNFKYREKFSTQKQHVKEIILSTKFINAITTSNTSALKWQIKAYAEEIIEKFNSREEWGFELIIVSNESFEITPNTDLENLADHYWLEIKQYWLNEITESISLKPEPIAAKIVIDDDAIMSFSDSKVSSWKSYIIRLSLAEVIRITCTDKTLRDEYNLEDISKLQSAKLDFSVLFDNVRWFITKSKFNSNILTTLQNDPTRFFIYNNGLTLTATDIDVEAINAGKKFKITLNSIQVLNGGQTLRTIHYFNSLDKNNIVNNLSNAQVSLRIFKVSDENDLNNKIAEFTNSQNTISNIDLKSLREEQLQLEQYLSEHSILYTRKSWDTWDKKIEYAYKISMERFGQILFSLNGFPEKATNDKKNIFDKYYNSLFSEDVLIIDDAPLQIHRYFQIQKEYKSTEFKVSDQKIFYILYLDKESTLSLLDIINKFEGCIKKYKKDEDVWEARKLIQKDFKKFIDVEFDIMKE